jgi:manganese/iron transport system substrate-binding protein
MIFAELSDHSKLLATVAKEAGVQLSTQPLLADGLGESGHDGGTYQSMLIANTKTLVQGLGGQYMPFKAQ